MVCILESHYCFMHSIGEEKKRLEKKSVCKVPIIQCGEHILCVICVLKMIIGEAWCILDVKIA